jgi:hypothetical protein
LSSIISGFLSLCPPGGPCFTAPTDCATMGETSGSIIRRPAERSPAAWQQMELQAYQLQLWRSSYGACRKLVLNGNTSTLSNREELRSNANGRTLQVASGQRL